MSESPEMNTGYMIERLASFSDGEAGGNPAGVVICDTLPEVSEMQKLAADVGYSETVFAAFLNKEWRVRYFAPEIEVPFCGHATIALGAALARRNGNGVFPLRLNTSRITVEGKMRGARLSAALQSPPTSSRPAEPDLAGEGIGLFGYKTHDLDMRIPPAVAEAGARHLIVTLKDRSSLALMKYDMSAGRDFMLRNGFATISLIYAETRTFFHARNPFAAGGVYEDPATGAAAAALSGYLRDIGWLRQGTIEIAQGYDMNVPSRILAEFSSARGESIRVSGEVRYIK